ncbi:MAG: transglutaminaseTgpA domain-containing protein [Coleofasciculus sp. G1-WW12-02]|uniref:transglutaminaseTgpA domain-containing protein n=1 Tax=Coleofasciculus sp. G1-WW12-02 TaxID=3068483 RepID=UPI0032FAD03D
MSNPSGMQRIRRLPGLNQVWQRLGTMPLPQTEDSIGLRVLVQGLVIVGIVATDIAAETQMSAWAVPLSIIGATWSWYRRRHRNIAVKFFLAIGMLIAMGVFFNNLLASLNDTRLVLAELLIQVQVLHSFDLPRRKDLGYSMVIGLILLGVAGTLSQTLAFAPLLLIFLAIALPTLILDYQSRIGLSPKPKRKTSKEGAKRFSPLSLRRLSIFLLVIIALGLGIFALMPRFPGYQLQTFPVSAPLDLDEQDFEGNNRGVNNPGYVSEGEGTGGEGTSPSRGAGEMDETFYYGFGTQINQNLRGALEPKVVLRVRSQSPGFWRVQAFDRYTGQGWELSREDQVLEVTRPPWSYRFQLYPTSFNLGRTKTVIQSYTAVSELPNIIPALSYPKQLYFPTREVAIDTEGSLRSPLALLEGLTYTVISEVPVRDRTQLQQAPDTYPDNIQKYYLDIPPEIADKVRQKTEQLLATSPKPLTSSYEKALYLAQEVKRRYRIPDNPLELPFLQEDEDLVEAFLFKYEGGYPDHFSTALTIMLRSIGIPARLVVGFDTGQFNPFTGLYIVKNTDAYAMTEVYFPNYGWFAFDPIPGHELVPQSVEDTETFSVLRQFWRWVAGWLPTPVSNFIGELWNLIIGSLLRLIVGLWAMLSSGWIGLFGGLILAIAVGFVGWLGWVQWQTWRYRRWLGKLPPMERLYQQMLKALGAKGYIKHPAQTPLEYARVMRQQQSSDSAAVIDEISQAYVRWRYGKQTPNIDNLRQRLRQWIKTTRRLGTRDFRR